MRFQMACEDARWRGSVVRMKSSLVQFSASAMRWNCGAFLSASSRALKPSLAAVCAIFMPCSSVPVRKRTS